MQDRDFLAPVDARFYNCAPSGLRSARLLGNERVSMWNLHRAAELVEVDLPGIAPVVLIEPPGCAVRRLDSSLATVLIEPEADQITLTWAAAMETADVYPQAQLQSMRYAVERTR
jgi:hypothetical protein